MTTSTIEWETLTLSGKIVVIEREFANLVNFDGIRCRVDQYEERIAELQDTKPGVRGWPSKRKLARVVKERDRVADELVKAMYIKCTLRDQDFDPLIRYLHHELDEIIFWAATFGENGEERKQKIRKLLHLATSL